MLAFIIVPYDVSLIHFLAKWCCSNFVPYLPLNKFCLLRLWADVIANNQTQTCYDNFTTIVSEFFIVDC